VAVATVEGRPVIVSGGVDGTVRRYAGQWYLVRSGSGWLMDQPALHPA